MLLALVMTAATAAAAAPAQPWPPAPKLAEAVKSTLRGVGTEPFWSMEITGQKITLTAPGPENDEVTEFKPESSTALGATAHSWTSGPLTVTVSEGACSDGMSEVNYPYSIEVTVTGKNAVSLKGCAYRSWGQDVVAAIPIIDACLALDATKPPISFAAATAPDAGYVMLSGSDDHPLQGCVVAGGKATLTPATADDIEPPGTNAEIFVRGPGENPGGECYEAPEVKDANGKLLGWWLDPMGC
ncbi:hypothetical protein sos41_28200 [Alphaproteobacteria bacterium SO-S41]|nr:hypothetical protein sos41_28200 [Alphaproteobacteria bacterium SO-S41]